MVVNGSILRNQKPIVDMSPIKCSGPGGTSYGLGEAGYDIRIKQEIRFMKTYGGMAVQVDADVTNRKLGRFCLASAMEQFDMPDDLMGIVHDKSTWARRGLQVFNTVIEPGWKGFLTLELAYWGEEDLIIPAGSGIAQVVFHLLAEEAQYKGKYQNQEDQPVSARDSV